MHVLFCVLFSERLVQYVFATLYTCEDFNSGHQRNVIGSPRPYFSRNNIPAKISAC